ncbi:MAG: SDR family NAD(P)-dependent oxidoreductase [Betaproteobacteria bacterium]|nr:SDR family NAD(P)-dependent oxidoreductase [Betaproteobacteria bacterium]
MKGTVGYGLVTGAASGIGLATCRRLAEDGFHAVMVDRDEERGRREAAVLEAAGLSAEFHHCDITDEAAVERLIQSLPPLRALVNCAGIFREAPVFDLTADDFRGIYEVNLIATFIVCRAAARRMERGAKIVNIASRAALGARFSAHYVASKGAVISFTRALALELLEKGIAVNAVGPGFIATPMTRDLSPERLKAQLALQPTGNAGRPEDVANAISFLVSPRTDFITGQVLLVDGGKSLGGVTAGA